MELLDCEMEHTMDDIGEAMDGASGGSGSYRRSDGLCERWIKEL